VLWDMDGTLIDSEPIWIRAQSRLVEDYGGTWTHDDGLTLVGVSMEDVGIALQAAGVPLTSKQIVDRLVQEVTAALEIRVPWRRGALELVKALAAAGVPQAIVTSAPLFLPQAVARALPKRAIQAIVAHEDVRNSKPHPEPYLIATRALDVPPAHCIAIEDSPAGLSSAIAAGVVAIGVPRDTPLDDPGRWTRIESLEGVGVDDLLRIIDSALTRSKENRVNP